MLLALLLAVVAPTLVAAPARAAASSLAVTLHAATVAGAKQDSKVEVTGEVSNPTDAPVYGVRITIVRSPEPYRSLAAVHNAITGQHGTSSEPLVALPGFVDQVTDPDVELAPGETAAFTVSGTLAQLGLSANASYWVGVEATASASPGAAASPTLSSTVETLATVPDATGPSVVTLVQLAATPRRLRPGLFSSDDLAAELTDFGRLGQLLDAVDTHQLDYAIDPELLDEVTDMADGYEVVDGDGSMEGTGNETAAAWLRRFRTLPKDHGVQTLYGSPDLVGAAAAGSASVQGRALAATRDSGLGLPVVALQRRVSKAALASLAGTRLPVISPAIDQEYPLATIGDTQVSGAFWASRTTGPAVLGGGDQARDAVALALARAVGTQVRLVTGEADLNADAALPGWVVRTRWSALSTRPSAGPIQAPTPASAKGALTKTFVRRIDRLALALTAYGSAAPRSGLDAVADRLAAAAASEAWLGSAAGRRGYLSLVEDRSGASDLRDGIVVSVTRFVTLASSSTTFPATITNHLPNAITVRVVGVSSNSARMSVTPSELVTIQPNDSEGVQLAATANANGVVSVTLHAESATGMKVSESAPVTLEATNLGFVGWIIMGASAIVLVVTTALRIRQVRRRATP